MSAQLWRRPRPAPPEAVEEMLEDVSRRTVARGEDRAAGFLDMFYERGHPLVRAAMRSTRKERWRALPFCVGLPLMLFMVAGALAADPATAGVAGWTAGLFAALWPLFLFGGASLGAAAGVVDERKRGTALQLVLTPIGKRPIAAAKVLPAAWPYLWGALAGLPVCVLAGGAEPLLVDGCWPTPLGLWPLRLAAPLGGFGAAEFSFAGCGLGLLMCATDLAVVWAAAHWGAAYGVRLGSLPLAAAGLAWRLALTGLFVAFCAAGSVFTGAALYFTLGFVLMMFHEWLSLAAVLGLSALVFLHLWSRYMLSGPVRMVLGEFTHFDELAQDEFRPRPLRGWAVLLPYGERT